MKNRTLKEIEEEFEQAVIKRNEEKKILQQNCKHDWEVSRSYTGTERYCRKCDELESN